MLIPATVTITMLSGVAPFGQSESSVVFVGASMFAFADPNKETGGTAQTVGGGLMLSPLASVIHSAEVSINPPTSPPT